MQEVDDFKKARQELVSFRAENAQLFEELDYLVENYNHKRAEAEKAVRAAGASEDEFVILSTSNKVDADKVLQAIGREKFLEFGGTITNKRVAKINAKALSHALAKGDITQDQYDEVVKVEHRYKVPKDLVTP